MGHFAWVGHTPHSLPHIFALPFLRKARMGIPAQTKAKRRHRQGRAAPSRRPNKREFGRIRARFLLPAGVHGGSCGVHVGDLRRRLWRLRRVRKDPPVPAMRACSCSRAGALVLVCSWWCCARARVRVLVCVPGCVRACVHALVVICKHTTCKSGPWWAPKLRYRDSHIATWGGFLVPGSVLGYPPGFGP